MNSSGRLIEVLLGNNPKIENSIEYEFADEPTENSEQKEEKAVTKPDYIQWAQVGESSFFPEGEIKLTKQIPAGVYDILYNQQKGYYLKGKQISLDELFILTSPEQGQILSDIQTFWKRKSDFKKYKFTYKRGILLFGPAGCGKSSVINLLASEIVSELKGIVLYLNSSDDLVRFQAIMPMLRQIEPDKQVLCVMEDLETFTSYREAETQLLNVLDGINQMDNVVYLGTTNFPEQLKERILNRPSRFDRRYEVGYPNEDVRREYFKKKLSEDDLTKIDLKAWVKQTKNLSLAHLGEIVKSVCALGNSFEDTMKLLNEMKKKLSSFDFEKEKTGGGVGFRRSDD
ncbi:MAG: ATP-binding protein [Bacteroidia bacterium]